jgi:hypothetical protein
MATMPGSNRRIVTLRSVEDGPAPDMAAASSSDGSMERMSGTSMRKAVGTSRSPSTKIMPPSE